MAEYYDRDRFTNGRRPGKKDSSWDWVAIVVLFGIGLWPIALVMLVVKWLSGDSKQSSAARVRQAQKAMDDTIDAALRGVAEAGGKPDGGERAAAEDQAQGPEPAQAAKKAAKPRAKSSARKAAVRKQAEKVADNGKVLWIIGLALMVLSTMILSEPIDDLIYLGTLAYSVEELILGLNFLIGGGALFARGQFLSRLSRRSRKYILAIGGAEAMEIELIAKRVGRTYDQAVKDLERMIDKGYLGDDVYLDLERGYFLHFGVEAEQPPREAPAQEADGSPYGEVLRKIRSANDRIADPVLSAKIDRLEQITGQILKEVEEHPEKRSKMGTFFDYYLPTTQKLLDTYAEFEATGVEGENLRAAKQRIEQTMDSIVEGFAHQLDNLYSADAMDVVSDIKVMETMLHRDTGSAAKDFGYDQYQEK